MTDEKYGPASHAAPAFAPSPISGQPIERELIAGLALIKGAGARVKGLAS